MEYILSPACLPVLERLARERTLCAFDFDGTLSPIVDHPEHAVMRSRTRQLLAHVAALYPCIILSGRARADVLAKMEGIGLAGAIGNHGAETGPGQSAGHARVGAWKATIEQQLKDDPRLWVEDKGLSLAIHYRQYPHEEEARQLIRTATQGLPGAHVYGGKQVVNVTEAGAPNKGTALVMERTRWQCDWVLFIGDDDNDEDGFSAPGNVVPIRVGHKPGSHARYFLESQLEIDQLLELISQLRSTATI